MDRQLVYAPMRYYFLHTNTDILARGVEKEKESALLGDRRRYLEDINKVVARGREGRRQSPWKGLRHDNLQRQGKYTMCAIVPN